MLTKPSRGLLAAALTIALAAVLAPAAAAQTLDSPWTGSGSGTTNVVSDGASAPAEFTYSKLGFPPTGTWEFSTTADSARAVELDWAYDGFHAWAGVMVGLEAFVTRGVDTTLTPLVNAGPTWCCDGEPSGGFSYDGTVTLSVQPGDTYGFKLSGSNADSDRTLNGTLTVDEPDDVTPPVVSCDPGVDSSGSSTPDPAAGFRQVNTSDVGTGIASLAVTDGVFTSGELTPASNVQLEVVPGSAGSDTRPGPGVLAAVIRTSGQPSLVATDGAGNATTVACGPVDPLPPPAAPPADTDGDGVADAGDNCPAVANADQSNIDGDAEGDACDADDDNDRVSDAAEARLGTSSSDLDSDDDGLGDGQEDRNGDGRKGNRETHPARFDTDRDGLGDGLERGVKRGVADPPGPIAGTGKRFRRDRHPRSKTSAVRADTDRGGVPDGREDKNGNGRVDKGETDPKKTGDRKRRRR
jgi:hypothetical protein